MKNIFIKIGVIGMALMMLYGCGTGTNQESTREPEATNGSESKKDIYVYFSKNMELFGIFPSITDTIKATKVSKYRIFGVIDKKIKDADGFIFSFQELS